MQPNTDSSPEDPRWLVRCTKHLRPWGSLLLFLLVIPNVRAGDVLIRSQIAPQRATFGRYLEGLQERDPFAECGPVGVSIQASLPDLYKEAGVVAIRKTGEHERSEYAFLAAVGDGVVAEEVIARYLEVHKERENLSVSSIAITPVNYKFRFAGEVRTGGAAAYIYDVTPKKNRPGLIVGKLWMDSETGHEVMLTGRLMDTPSIGQHVDLVRDTKLLDGAAYARVTHLVFAIPRLGRAELVITEILP